MNHILKRRGVENRKEEATYHNVAGIFVCRSSSRMEEVDDGEQETEDCDAKERQEETSRGGSEEEVESSGWKGQVPFGGSKGTAEDLDTLDGGVHHVPDGHCRGPVQHSCDHLGEAVPVPRRVTDGPDEEKDGGNVE